MDTYNSLSEETIRILEAQNWKEVLTKLHVAIVKAFGISLTDVLPGGIQARDLASNAILSLYDGTRHWDHVREPNVAKFLFNSVVRSHFSHLLEASSTKLISRIRKKKSSVERETDEEVTSPSVFEPSYSIEEQVSTNDIIARVKAALHSDKIARDVFGLRLDGCTDKAVAYFLNITIGQVRAANRRISQVGKVLFPNHIRV